MRTPHNEKDGDRSRIISKIEQQMCGFVKDTGKRNAIHY